MAVFPARRRHFLAYSRGNEQAGFYVGSLDSRDHLRLSVAHDPHEFSPLVYVMPGYLLFVDNRVLFAQPFDAKRLKLTGEPIRVADGVYNAGPGAAFSVSTGGVLAYWSGTNPVLRQLTWVRRDGTPAASLGTPFAFSHFTLAPDQRQVAIARYEPGLKRLQTAIWLLDVQRGYDYEIHLRVGSGRPGLVTGLGPYRVRQFETCGSARPISKVGQRRRAG